tara:strand:+ start:1103 stop:1210 length:108 start_codon:yes stop_codon:yes gene_type:complete
MGKTIPPEVRKMVERPITFSSMDVRRLVKELHLIP